MARSAEASAAVEEVASRQGWQTHPARWYLQGEGLTWLPAYRHRHHRVDRTLESGRMARAPVNDL
ncbi:MAG: hypothetical protein IPH55_17105 [Betaproteobacteria bacterium]|nr:hypothetical protein [Betaproteobacteria bacterium]